MQPSNKKPCRITITASAQESDFLGVHIDEVKISFSTRVHRGNGVTITNRLRKYDSSGDTGASIDILVNHSQLPHTIKIYSKSHFEDKYNLW